MSTTIKINETVQSGEGNNRVPYTNRPKRKAFRPRRFTRSSAPYNTQAGRSDLTPADALHLKKIQKKELKKAKRLRKKGKIESNLSSLEIRTPSRPGRRTLQLDLTSVMSYIRGVIEMIAMEYPMMSVTTNVAPNDLRFYLFAILFSYLNKVGTLNGSLSVALPQIRETYQIPKPFAKFLQYLAPFRSGGFITTTSYNYVQDLIAYTNACGLGDNLHIGAPGDDEIYVYGNTQACLIMQMSSVPENISPAAAVPADQPKFILTTYSTPQTLSQWMQTPGNMDRVSSALQQFKIPCVDATWMPGFLSGYGFAPDGSAYVALNQTTPLDTNELQTSVPAGACWISQVSHYDPEVAYLFTLGRVMTDQPGYAAKPLPLPFFDYNADYAGTNVTTPIPWYMQPMYVTIWLANNCDKLSKGPWKSLRVKKTALRTLFPNVRALGGGSMSTLLAHAYQQIQAVQSNAIKVGDTSGAIVSGGVANDDQVGTNWYLMWVAVVQAAQRRYNVTQVVPASVPIFQNTATEPINFIYPPQFNWVDQAAVDTELPPTLSALVTAIGPVIHYGVLFVPYSPCVNDSGSINWPVTSQTSYGPIPVSGFGWDPKQLQTFTLENLNTPVSFDKSVQSNPNDVIPINLTLDGLTVDDTFVTNYVGWNYTASPPTLYPPFYGGVLISKYQRLHSQFVQGGNPVNTAYKNLTVPDTSSPLGSIQIANETNLNNSAIETSSLVPNNQAVINGSSGSDQIIEALGPGRNGLTVVRTPAVTVLGENCLTEALATETLANALTLSNQQPVSNTLAQRKNRTKYIYSYISGVGQSVVATNVMTGKYTLNPKSGNSISSILNQLSMATLHPDSSYSKAVKEISELKERFGSVVPTIKKTVLDKAGPSLPYKKELQKMAVPLFGDKGRVPDITASSLGILGKGFSDKVAANLAIIESNLSTTTNTSQAVVGGIKHKKVVGDILDGVNKVGKMVKDVSDHAVKDVNSALSVAKSVGGEIKSVGDKLGALFDV